LQPYLLIYLPTRPYTGVLLYTIIARTISDTFRIGDFMNCPFPTHHDRQLRPTEHPDLGTLIADAICIDKSIELRLRVTDTISCGWLLPIGPRRVATPTNEKSYVLEIYKLQIQNRHELSTQSRSTAVPTFRLDNRGQSARRCVCDKVC
jgi:hypothetical protein